MPTPDRNPFDAFPSQPSPALDMFSAKKSDATTDDLLRELISEVKGLRSDIAAKKWLSDEDMRWFRDHHEAKP